MFPIAKADVYHLSALGWPSALLSPLFTFYQQGFIGALAWLTLSVQFISGSLISNSCLSVQDMNTGPKWCRWSPKLLEILMIVQCLLSPDTCRQHCTTSLVDEAAGLLLRVCSLLCFHKCLSHAMHPLSTHMSWLPSIQPTPFPLFLFLLSPASLLKTLQYHLGFSWCAEVFVLNLELYPMS